MPTTTTDLRTWTLSIPAPYRMLSANGNKPWQQTSEAKRLWRQAVHIHALKAKLPRGLAKVRVDIELHFTANRDRRDPPNYHPYVAKPAVDALGPNRLVRTVKGVRNEVGYGLIPDDTPSHLDGPYITIGASVSRSEYPFGLAVITITDLPHDPNLAATGA